VKGRKMKLSLNQRSSELLLQVKDKTQKQMSALLAEAMELLHNKYKHEVLNDQKNIT
jgi:hypothetical protein